MADLTWWAYDDNKMLMDDDNNPLICVGCPCGCYTDIKERQAAYGVTAPWNPGNPADPARFIDDSGDTTYTLLQLKSYVNILCSEQLNPIYGGFIQSPYTGGANAPVHLGPTYANSATDVDELCELVKAMLQTQRKATLNLSVSQLWRGQSVQGAGAGWGAVKAAAEADWQQTSGIGETTPWGQMALTTPGADYYADAIVYACGYDLVAPAVPEAPDRSATLYMQFIQASSWSVLNSDLVTQNHYAPIGTVPESDWAAATTDRWYSLDFPSPWPANPLPDVTHGYLGVAYYDGTSCRAVYDWDFTNVPEP